MYPMQPMYGAPGYGFRAQSPYQQPAMMAAQPVPNAAQQPVGQPPTVTPVTDIRQAELAAIPFDELPYYYHDTSTGDIYVKRFDRATGKSPIVVYKQVIPEQPAPPQYVTMDMLQALARRVDDLAAALQPQQEPVRPRKASRKEDEEA